MAHDAFISYSHAADAVLAPALETALQRFAKPWYQIRALSIFRDASNLNLSPDLWNGISTALGGATHLVYLASPQAAASKWVGKEIEYWLTNRSIERLVIVVTDGAIEWDDAAKDFDWNVTTCLPRSAAGRFSGEPFYLDLRWARQSTDLSLQHPRFKDAVALLAATIHGKPVEDMIGEDVVQHQRTTRIRNVAIAALLTLFVAASVAAIVAVRQRSEAVRQRTEAVHQRDLAVQSSLLNRVRSELESGSLMEAVQTARESRRRFGLTPLVRQTLLEATSHPTNVLTTMREPVNSAPRVSFSPDDAQILSVSRNTVGSFAARVRDWLAHELRSFEAIYLARYGADASHLVIGWPWAAWGQAEEDGSSCNNNIAAPPVTDYAVVGLQRVDISAKTSPGVDLPIGYRDSAPDGRLHVSICGNYVHVVDASGTRVGSVRVPGVAKAMFSPDGTHLAMATPQRTSIFEAGRISVPDATRVADVPGGSPVFAYDGHSFATIDRTTTIVFDLAGRELARRPGVSPAFGPRGVLATVDGSTTSVWQASARDAVRLSGNEPRFSPDGQWVMTTLDGQRTRISDLDGNELTTLDGASGQFAHRAPVALTATATGIIRLYDLRRAGIATVNGAARVWGIPVEQLTPLAPPSAGTADCMMNCAFADGTARVSVMMSGVTPGAAATAVVRITSADGAVSAATSQQRRECLSPVAPLVFSPAPHSVVAVGCGNGALLVYEQSGAVRWRLTQDGAITRVRFSKSGQQLLTTSADRTARILDAARGTEIARLTSHESEVIDGVFSPDAQRILTITQRGTLLVWDRSESGWNTSPTLIVARPDDQIAAALFDASSSQVIARTQSGRLHRWLLDGDAWLQQYEWVESLSQEALRGLGLP